MKIISQYIIKLKVLNSETELNQSNSHRYRAALALTSQLHVRTSYVVMWYVVRTAAPSSGVSSMTRNVTLPVTLLTRPNSGESESWENEANRTAISDRTW